ncbi:MAG TPA: hypothetical protein VGV60_04080 [Candidatus Polarisedimenticolia bacterium]|jgi:hypothetical protein|nr:hypothetical protein [Candidatus Polarisedimenticolia bacterium]
MSRWIVLACVLACTSALAASGAPPARGADSRDASPLTLDLDFAAADRSFWGDGGWFSTPDYHALGKLTFGGVALRANYSKRRGTWDSGFEMSARERRDGMIEVKVRATVNNPGDNHDRRITARLDVVNGDRPVQSGTIAFEAEDNGNDVSGQTTLVIRRDDLMTSPMTRLRLTLTAEED